MPQSHPTLAVTDLFDGWESELGLGTEAKYALLARLCLNPKDYAPLLGFNHELVSALSERIFMETLKEEGRGWSLPRNNLNLRVLADTSASPEGRADPRMLEGLKAVWDARKQPIPQHDPSYYHHIALELAARGVREAVPDLLAWTRVVVKEKGLNGLEHDEFLIGVLRCEAVTAEEKENLLTPYYVWEPLPGGGIRLDYPS